MSISLRRRPATSSTPGTSFGTASCGTDNNGRKLAQTELRELRRSGLIHVYSGGWSLADEIEAITEPLAARVAAEQCPHGFWLAVETVAEAAHSLVSEVAAVLALTDAEAATAKVAPDARGRSIRLMCDLAPRPELPTITDEHLADGTWPDLLIGLAQPYTERLSKLLSTAYVPGHYNLRGKLSVSERLCRELREVDRAARTLHHKLDVAARHREQYPAPPTAATSAESKRAELAALGVELPDQPDLASASDLT